MDAASQRRESTSPSVSQELQEQRNSLFRHQGASQIGARNSYAHSLTSIPDAIYVARFPVRTPSSASTLLDCG
jgi:hypothetical protein